MPRQVHEVLIDHGVIEDPCLPGGRTRECLWVAETDWVYRCTFSAAGARMSFLHFRGLDTFADVYLNGEAIGSHNDAFLPLIVDVSGRIQAENELIIHFHSPHAHIAKLDMPEAWQGRIQPHRLVRKHHHDFGDYLGAKPYFTNVGVYDSIFLEQADRIVIREVDITQRMDIDHVGATVGIRIKGEGDPVGLVINVSLKHPDGSEGVTATAELEGTGNGSWACASELKVAEPELWWPRGHGAQPMYALDLTVYKGEEVCGSASRPIGFRSVHIDERLRCTVNGRAIKLWGGNLAPITGWTHRWIPERALSVLDRAELCNMKCLRIWGGGERYDDRLYDEADRRGILLWQDFFNEYGSCPDSEDYLRLCGLEAEYQVGRLKHHPSILMWCGGNEGHMGRDFSFGGEELIGQELFEKVYPDVCRRLDPDRYYHINSPYGGAFANDPSEGDNHNYTTTWFVPGVEYPVFTTENMRVSAAPNRSMVRYLGADQVWPEGYDGRMTKGTDLPWPASWEARTSGNSLRKIPAIERYYDPIDGESLIYNFGAAHGEYLRSTVEAHRRGRSSDSGSSERISQGHLVWKLNATWPHLYSNIIDYYFEPYIPFYALKRAYEPILLSFDIADHIHLWLVNDTPFDLAGTYRIVLFDMRGNRIVDEMSGAAQATAGESVVLTSLDSFGQFDKEHILFAEFTDSNGRKRARSVDYLAIERYLRFPEAELKIEVEDGAIHISTGAFARSVELSGSNEGDEFGWIFEDNYFDLMPWERKTVRVSTEQKHGVIKAKSRYSAGSATAEYP